MEGEELDHVPEELMAIADQVAEEDEEEPSGREVSCVSCNNFVEGIRVTRS